MGIQKNIRDREAAELLMATMLDLIQSDFKSLPSREAKLMFCRMVHDKFAPRLEPRPSCVEQPVIDSPTPVAKNNPAVDAAMEICERIESLADEVPSPGWDFASDVVDQMNDVRKTIIDRDCVTDKQMRALENWEHGLSKWIRD